MQNRGPPQNPRVSSITPLPWSFSSCFSASEDENALQQFSYHWIQVGVGRPYCAKLTEINVALLFFVQIVCFLYLAFFFFFFFTPDIYQFTMQKIEVFLTAQRPNCTVPNQPLVDIILQWNISFSSQKPPWYYCISLITSLMTLFPSFSY